MTRLLVLFAVSLLPATVSLAADAARPLSWAPPELVDPITVAIKPDQSVYKLDPAKDYRLVMPDEPVTAPGGLILLGGRNVVLIGGEVRVPLAADAPKEQQRRALYLKEQTGTVHIEGLLLAGEDLVEGINLDQRKGAVVQLQNVRVELVEGTYEGWHADLLQTWAGPAELRIDGFTGRTSYQGFFLLPNQHFEEGPRPAAWDFRNMNLIGNERSAYLLWAPSDSDWPITLQNVWLSPNPNKAGRRDQWLWPKPSQGGTQWGDAQEGTPPGGDFVPEGSAGLGYVSPGYAGSTGAPGSTAAGDVATRP